MKTGFVEIEVNKLIKAAWNYKSDDDKLKAKLSHNIKKRGLIENILVREISKDLFEVINGNHRLECLQDLQFTSVVCYNFGEITQTRAIEIGILTNETNFSADKIKLSKLIAGINGTSKELSVALPYSESEIERLRAITDFNLVDFVARASVPGESDEDKEQKSPKIKTKLIQIVMQKSLFDLWLATADELKTGETIDEVAAFNEIISGALESSLQVK